MAKLKQLKKELKEAQRELRQNKNVDLNKELIETLQKEINVKQNLKNKGYKTKLFDKIVTKFDKYDPNIKLLDNVKYAGRNITRIRFDANKFKRYPFTISKVQEISNQLSEYMKELNLDGRIMTSMKYGDIGWRSGYFDDIGENVGLYSPADSGYEIKTVPKIDSFVVYAYFKPSARGGDDFHNDCLYNCLMDTIWRINKYRKYFK